MMNFVEFGLQRDCKLLHKFKVRIRTELMEKNCIIFAIKELYFLNFLDYIWTAILNFLNFLDYGWTWTEFSKFRTGSGSQNMTVCSSLRGLGVGFRTGVPKLFLAMYSSAFR